MAASSSTDQIGPETIGQMLGQLDKMPMPDTNHINQAISSLGSSQFIKSLAESSQERKLEPPKLSQIMEQLKKDPAHFMESGAGVIDMFGEKTREDFKKVAMSNQHQVLKEMSKKGISPADLRQAHHEGMKTTKEMNKKLGITVKPDAMINVLVINASRKIKNLKIKQSQIETEINKYLCKQSNQVDAYNLKVGPLAEFEIEIFYDPTNGSLNRLATRIAGFPIGGSIVLVDRSKDLKENDLNDVIKILNGK